MDDKKASLGNKAVKLTLLIFAVAIGLMFVEAIIEGPSDEPPKGSIIQEITSPNPD